MAWATDSNKISFEVLFLKKSINTRCQQHKIRRTIVNNLDAIIS